MRMLRRPPSTILLVSCLSCVDGNIHIVSGTNLRPLPFRRLDSSCIGSSLYPGQSLHASEFLCRGQQRFGIDASGRLVLGLSSSDDVSPSLLAWQAAPTTLFVECRRAFSYIELSEEGNILGYDADGSEIYDSNLDYGNRLRGKLDGSVLGFSSSCGDFADAGELCLKLTSPPWPGLPWGVVTWGVAMDADRLVPADMTEGPSSYPSVQATNLTDIPANYPTRHPITETPSFLPTTSPIVELKSYIFGNVWLDSDANVWEKPIPGVTVHLYECANDTSPIDTKITDAKGWYFFQVAQGGSYKAHFDVNDLRQVYEFTDGNATDVRRDGWTDCMSPTMDDPVQLDAGLHNVVTEDGVPQVAATPLVANSKIGGAIFIDLNGDGSMDSFEDNAVEKEYTVPDAVVHVSVHDCKANVMIQSEEVPFPGEYIFNDLTEGLYKIEFDIVLVKQNKQTKESRLPLYFFSVGNDDSSSFETNCINLRRNEANTSVHAGIRIPKLKVNTKVLAETPLSSSEANITALSAQEAGIGFGKKKPSVAGLVVGILSAVALVAGAFLFIYNQRSSSPDDTRSCVASVGGSMEGDLSAVSTPSAAIGSLIVESNGSVAEAETKENEAELGECGSNNNDDDVVNETERRDNADVEIDQLHRNPYNQNVSSIFETESIDSDPYIYTGDEQESLGSDPYVDMGDESVDFDKDKGDERGYRRSDYSRLVPESSCVEHCQQLGYGGTSSEHAGLLYHYEESSVVSHRSFDPPAASYRDIPSAARTYRRKEHMPVVEDAYRHASFYRNATPATAADVYRSDDHMPEEQDVYHHRHMNNSHCQSFDSDDSSTSYDESESSYSRSSSSSTNNSDSRHTKKSDTHTGRTQHSSTSENELESQVLHRNYFVGPIIDDQSVMSAQSDHSADPPGASYQCLGNTHPHGRGRHQGAGGSISLPPLQRPPLPSLTNFESNRGFH